MGCEQSSFFFYRSEIDDVSLGFLFTAGPPMYLGFLIHMVLHFVILQAEIDKRS